MPLLPSVVVRRPWAARRSCCWRWRSSHSLPPYLTLDPSRSRVAPPAGVPGYYPALVAHVVFGSIAMITACLQVWPGCADHPEVHRRLGRSTSSAACCRPADGTRLAPSALRPRDGASNVVLAIVWLTVTMTGFAPAAGIVDRAPPLDDAQRRPHFP
jgi:hypothetical protein